jgi:hypothetical protein
MKSPQKLIWYKTSFSKEKDVFIEVAKDFTPGVDLDNRRLTQVALKRAQRITLAGLERAYNDATPKILTDSIWRRLSHTESYTTRTTAAVDKALARINRTTADLSNIIDEFNTGRIRAPIVLQYGNQYRLIAGNVRLMVARVGEIPPKVVFVKYSW